MNSKLEVMKAKWLWDPRIRDTLEEKDKMCNAIFNENMDEVKKIIKTNGINARTTISDLSLLHLACKYEKLELVKYLMVNGADNNIRDCNGRTPLFYSVHHKDTEIIDALELNEVTKNYIDNFYLESVYYADNFNDTIFNYLNTKSIDSPNDLHSTRSRKFFIDFELKLNKNTIDDFELILYANQTKDFRFITDVVKDFIDVKDIDNNGYTILHKIFMNCPPLDRNWITFNYFIDGCINKGANINAITKDGLSLSKIVINNNMEFVFLDKLYYCFSYAWPKDNFNRTDLQYSIINKKDQYFYWFIKTWPQFNSTDIDGNSCLHLAVIHHTDINYETDDWESSYIIKIIESCEHRLLYVKNNDNKTALDLARETNKINIIQLLEELMDKDTNIFVNKSTNDSWIERVFYNYFLIRAHCSDKNDAIDQLEILNMAGETFEFNELIKRKQHEKSSYGRILLHYLIQFSDQSVIKNFQKQNPTDCLKRDSFGHTPFAYAGFQNKEIFSYFNNEVKQICSKATFFILQKETEQFIQELDAYNRFKEYCQKENLTTYDLASTMRALCRFNEEILIKLVTQIGINLERTEADNKKTPLQIAVESYEYEYSEGWLILLRNLIEIGDDIHIKRTEDDASLLHLGVGNESSTELFQFLLGHSIDINVVDSFGRTVIHKIIMTLGDLEFLEMLYNHADIEAVDKDGNNYLHYSVKYIPDDWECYCGLKHFDLNPEKLEYSYEGIRMAFIPKLMKKNNLGRTPFHIACELGKLQMFESLLIISTNNLIFIPDNCGKTALDYAVEESYYKIIWKCISTRCSKADVNFIELCFNNDGDNKKISGILATETNQNFFEGDESLIGSRYGASELLKLFEEFSMSGIQLTPEMEFTLQKILLDSDLIVENKNNLPHSPKDPKVDFQRIKDKTVFLICKTNEVINKLSESGDIDTELYHNIIQIIINISQLKGNEYIKLPWLKIEFILISFLTIYSNQNQCDLFLYRIVLNKKRIENHLKKFVENLKVKLIEVGLFCLNAVIKKPELLPEYTHAGLNEIQTFITDIQEMFVTKETGKQSKNKTIKENEEFKDLNKDFEAVRTFYSLSKILHYVNKSVDVQIRDNKKINIFVIMRTIQVFGEYIKNSEMSPNISKETENDITSQSRYLQICLTKIRNDLSHSDYMKNILDMESNIELYIKIQNDLRITRTFLINRIFLEREKHIGNLLRNMFYCKTENELNDLCFNFIKRRIGTECDNFLQIKTLIQNLKDIFVFQTKDQEIMFSKIDAILLNAKSNSSLGYNFCNPDTFFFSTKDRIRRDETIVMLQTGEIQNESTEPFQHIGYFILQIMKTTEIESFLIRKEIFINIQNICNEILFTSIIGVKEKIVAKLKIRKLSLCVQSNVQQNIQKQFQQYLQQTVQQTVQQTTQQNKKGKKKENQQRNNEEEKIIEELKQLNRDKLNSNDEFMKFTKIIQNPYFSPCKMGSPKVIKQIDENKRIELKKCFNDRINMLNELLPTNTKYLKFIKDSCQSHKMAVEFLVLNLFNILTDLGMMETKVDILDSFVPLMSTKSLRNYLAHGDALYDILPFRTDISVFANANKLANLIKESKFNISDPNSVIYYSQNCNFISSFEERSRLKIELYKSENTIISNAIKCNPLGSLCYFYKILNLRGVDIQRKTFFNLMFENDPKKLIHFFMNHQSNKIIRSPQLMNCVEKLFHVVKANLNLVEIDNLCHHLVNQLFIVTEQYEIVNLLIKICALQGYHNEIDEICADNNIKDEDYEIFLKTNYNTVMNFAYQYKFIINVKRYSKTCIPQYEKKFTLLHLAAAFNHPLVLTRLLKLDNYDGNVRTPNEKTPLIIATECQHKQIIQILMSKVAK